MLTRKTGGLTALNTEQLKHILKKVYLKELPCPFTRADLLVRGLNAVAEEGDLLFGLNEAGVRAVIAAALAERKAVEHRIRKR